MLIRDPCGICCIIVTYFAIFYADYVVLRWIVIETMQNSAWGILHAVLFNAVVLLLALSHLKAALTDPGTVPLPQTRMDFSDIHSAAAGGNLDPSIDPSSEWSVCARCETYRPPRAHHCRVCNRCIRRMDHHCPWINNCVGERNHRYFVLFLLYVAVLATYASAMVLISWLGKNEELEAKEDIQTKQARIQFELHTVILLLESALFGMFVTAILFEQLQVLAGNYDEDSEPLTIDNSVSRKARKSHTAQIKDICGKHTHPILWLLPFAIGESYRVRKMGSVHHHV